MFSTRRWGRVLLRVLAVLGGESIGRQALMAWAEWAEVIAAADGGIHHLEGTSIRLHLHVGDMDSLSSVHVLPTDLTHQDTSPDQSDLDKLLAKVIQGGGTKVALACVHGGRMDHFLASFSSAIATNLDVRWILPEEQALLLRPGAICEFSTGGAKRISLLPLEGRCLVRSQGLKWELGDSVLEVGQHWSLSNEAIEDVISIQVSGGHVALMIESLPWQVPAW